MVYATGVDSRIMSVQRSDSGQWVFLSLFRGQSNDIKSLLLVTPGELISAGVNTDICVYKLAEGSLGDQYGRDSEQQKHHAKLRHVPPFPQQSPIRTAANLVLLKAADNQRLQLFSSETSDEVLRIEKCGDYGIDSFAFDGRFIVYSDCKETHVFSFDLTQLKLRKLTRKICSANSLSQLPPA